MKKNLFKALSLLMAGALCITLTGCGSGDNTADENVVTYKAITEATFPPFDTTDDNGNIVGFDMDLMNAIGEDQGFKVEYTDMAFDSLIPALESGQADMITAGMNAEDPERQKKVDFSDTYYDSGLVVVVKSDNNTITGFDSLNNTMKVASQNGTTGGDKANELQTAGKIASATILDKFSDAMLQLDNGDVDAVIIDKPVAEAYIKKQEGKAKIVGDVLNAESYGFAVQKGNTELLNKINAGLKNLKENGKFDELLAKWFD